jgi:hypothetical protein
MEMVDTLSRWPTFEEAEQEIERILVACGEILAPLRFGL